MREQLDQYISRGNYLREEVQYIGDNIQNKDTDGDPRLFYFVEASSGMGKTQLAASLSLPVVYIPWTDNQNIDRFFDCVSQAIHRAIKDDRKLLLDLDENVETANDLAMQDEELCTVGLLVTLFKEVYGMTNDESLRVLSGYDGERILKYYSMSLDKAKKDVNTFMTINNRNNINNNDNNKNQYRAPIFFIDEVPSNEPKVDGKDNLNYLECVFLRNTIRVMKCICILSSTNSALMNALDEVSIGSRWEIDIPYSRLIVKLPHTNWDAICHDSKYAELIPSLCPEILDMLKSTRPLFVQYVLNAMLEEIVTDASYKIGELTAKVLSKVKREIVDKKTSFATLSGLFGQIALVYPKILSYTVDEWSVDDEENEDDLKLLEALRETIVRDHFGRLHVKDLEDAISPLYLASNYIYLRRQFGEFKPDFDFELPCNDPLLYLICIRDGLYGTSENNRITRFSSSYALKTLFTGKNSCFRPLLINTNQNSCSPNFLEAEAVSAAIIASHSYNSLSGCPFDVFLGSVLAELNPFQDYIEFHAIKEISGLYQDVKVGLLSPANLNWQRNPECLTLQKDSIVLGACDWRSNEKRSNVSFPVIVETSSMLMGLVDVQCYEGNISANQLIKTIRDTVTNGHLISIIVVTKLRSIRSTNQKFKDATVGVNVAVIEGNAHENQLVATVLKWKDLVPNNNNMETGPKHTVILIDLKSIYYNRNELMKICYQAM